MINIQIIEYYLTIPRPHGDNMSKKSHGVPTRQRRVSEEDYD